ncbi:MAG TPA: hypothetical protein VF158_08275 [Longimicrobiales bacterium]
MPHFLDFDSFPLALNLVIATAAAVGVWVAGTRLTREADAIAQLTGAGQAFVGLILLGAIVSLPELSTSVTAAMFGDAAFAVNTLLGGISAVMVALAVVDAFVREQPISSDIRHPIVLLQGVLTVLFLVVAAAGMTVGDTPLLGAGAWSLALLVLYLLCVLLVQRYQRREPWVPSEEARARSPELARRRRDDRLANAPRERRPLRRVVLATSIAAAVTLVTGVLLAGTGRAIAHQTGLGSGFVGLLLGGIATSLPEATTFYAAVQLRRFELAFGDAFGTNLFSTMAIYIADLVHPGGPILSSAGRFDLFSILLGIAVTTTYLAGCIERRNRRVLGMGVDSLVVLALYIGGMFLLYRLR